MHKYFLNLTLQVAKASDSKIAQVGAILVKDEEVIGIGYNKCILGGLCEEDGKTKSSVVHAEVSAMAGKVTSDCTLYVSHCPCTKCAVFIATSGIKEVVFIDNFKNNEGMDLLIKKNIKITKYGS